MQITDKKWDINISSKNSIWKINFRELWAYRDLIWLFVRRDLVTNYAQTILGPLWHLIQPICSTVMYLIVFGKFAGMGTDGIPQVLFYYAGSMLWGYFASMLTMESNVFTINSSLFGKVYFPRLTAPIATAICVFVKFLIQFALFVVLYIVYMIRGENVGLTVNVLLIPVILIWTGMLGMGMGLIISAVTTRYHDLAMALGFIMSLAMYATPVVYPLSEITGPLKTIFMINPVSAPMECFRISCFNAGNVSTYSIVYSIVCSVIILLIGILLFNKNEKSFVDVI